MAEKHGLQDFAQAMKRDWDERALKDAKWFINSLRLDQSEEEFDQSGVVEIERLVLADLPLLAQGRDPKSLRVLEIGCGAGRMTKHLAAVFGEVAGVDVSGEMIRQARTRLAGIANARLYETSGVDFAIFPDEGFDLILSAYVFQHVPSAEVIVSNIREAWRVLKPGGVFKFQTNGVTAAVFEQAEKDTWAGASFPESEIRRFARKVGAQLISVFGGSTQYCWTTIRKRVTLATARSTDPQRPRIEFFGRTVDALNKTIPTKGERASLTIIASGLDRELVDCNSASVVINDLAVAARYVGPIGRNFEDALESEFGDQPGHLTQIEIGVPTGVPTGVAKVRLQIGEVSFSEPIESEFVSEQLIPKIGTVMNARDHGTDIYARGEKSRLKIVVEGLDETASVENVRVQIGEQIIQPDGVSFHPGNAIYEVDTQLPEDVAPGSAQLRIHFGGLQSSWAMIN
ncbi:MAG: class I SAM-dependent methyltransferase, partial [Blastocatellia bacterium]